MYKLILSDYRSHFKSTIKKMWKEISCPLIILIMDMFWICDNWNYGYLTLGFPCILSYIIAKMYGGRLNKTFFLCPMDAKTRRQYAIENYRLRVIIPTIIFLVLNVIGVVIGSFDIWLFLIRFIIFECIAISSNVYCQSEHVEDMDREISLTMNKYTTVNVWSNLVNALTGIVAICVTSHKFSEIVPASKIVFLGLIALQLIITIYKVKRFYWPSIVDMDFYK